jgi:biopolymer transport protein ExbD
MAGTHVGTTPREGAMARSGAFGQAFHGDINVVPMLDILLVLLVIFMVLQETRRAVPLQFPPPVGAPATGQPSAVVLALRADGSYAINGTAVSATALEPRLREIYLDRAVKTLFLRVAAGRRYQEVIDATGVARRAGVRVVGVTPGSETPPAFAPAPRGGRR